MRSILEQINSTPSKAIEFAITGINRLSTKEGYVNDMSTFGSVSRTYEICYGCAATAAVQEMWMKDFTPENIYSADHRANALDLDPHELCKFESAIDSARGNSLEELGVFCDCDLSVEEATVDYIISSWINDGSTEYSLRVLNMVHAALISSGK
jgi:hypothetical protein